MELKKYDNYKDSGVEWLGEIPEHWEVRKLKYLFDIIPSNVDKKTKEDELEVLLCNYVDVYKNDKITFDIDFMNATASNSQIEKLTLKKFDVIATKDSEDPNDIGVPALVLDNMNGVVCGYHLTLFRSKNSHILGNYLYWFLKSKMCSQYFSTLARGITRYALGTSAFSNLPLFNIIDVDEITTIANYLDHKTTQIDTLISKKEAFISLLQEEKIAIINQAVTKGLDPNVPIKDSGIEWLGEIPEHWEVKKIKYLGKILSGFSFKSDDFIKKDGCRVMKISNIQTMNIDWSDESFVPHSFYEIYSNFQIKKGDLVFALTRPIISTGIKASIVDIEDKILLNQRNAVLKPTDKLNVNWMYYIVFNPKFINHFETLIDRTGQQPNISSTDISNIPIPLPSKKEQELIINYVSIEEKKINNIIFKVQQEIELLKEYKTALISEVVTGKVDVRNEVLN